MQMIHHIAASDSHTHHFHSCPLLLRDVLYSTDEEDEGAGETRNSEEKDSLKKDVKVSRTKIKSVYDYFSGDVVDTNMALLREEAAHVGARVPDGAEDVAIGFEDPKAAAKHCFRYAPHCCRICSHRLRCHRHRTHACS
jgi:hypothetical protein